MHNRYRNQTWVNFATSKTWILLNGHNKVKLSERSGVMVFYTLVMIFFTYFEVVSSGMVKKTGYPKKIIYNQQTNWQISNTTIFPNTVSRILTNIWSRTSDTSATKAPTSNIGFIVENSKESFDNQFCTSVKFSWIKVLHMH